MNHLPLDQKASRLALGMAALGRPGYINLTHSGDLPDVTIEGMRGHAWAMLDTAWKHGIRHFDCARSYGRAEEFVGGWLRARQDTGVLRPDIVTISSKWGYEYTANWQIDVDGPHEIKDHSLQMLQKQWGETQSHLAGWLDLYQIHSATLSTGVLDDPAVIAELARLRDEHGIRVGLTLSGTGQARTLDKALTVMVDGAPLFSSVQATWNLLERSAGDALAAAHDAGWMVIVKEALANGRLTPANDDPTFAGQRRILREAAARLNTTVDALALAAVLHNPWADVVLLGAAQHDHLESNVQALDVAFDQDAADHLSGLAEPPGEYWRHRSRLAWN
ncbi:MAG: aldo/keto reductase [Chloroflexota bacterium]